MIFYFKIKKNGIFVSEIVLGILFEESLSLDKLTLHLIKIEK